MRQLRTAIYNGLVGLTKVVSIIGTSDAITAGWPEQNAGYTPSQLGDVYENLGPPTGEPRARVTFILVSPSRDPMLRTHKRDDTFQIDVWGPNPELNEEVAEEIEDKLHGDSANFVPLSIASPSVIKETYCTRTASDRYEADNRLYHTISNLRVLWDP